jgi:hypothetical protein
MGGLAAAQLGGNAHRARSLESTLPCVQERTPGTVLYWFESSRVARYQLQRYLCNYGAGTTPT